MSAPKQISREEMEALFLDRGMTPSPATRQALLTGSVLELPNGERYQCPMIEHERPTHYTNGAIVTGAKDPHRWN